MRLNDKQLNEIYQKTISNINFNKKQIQDQHDKLNNNNNDYILKIHHLQLLKNYKKLNVYLNIYKSMIFNNRYPIYEIIRLDSVLNKIINNITVYDGIDYIIPRFEALTLNY